MQDFTNGTLDLELLPKYEEVPLHALSRKYWNVILLNITILLSLIAAVLVAILVLIEEVRPYIYVIAGIYIAFSLLLIFLYRASLHRRGYALREKDLIYRSGIIAISTSVIPFARIQHIALNEGIFSRIFQLGALHVFTAGGASGSITIAGIDIEQAKQIKEILTKQLAQID